MKRSLLISIIIFIVVSLIAFYMVLFKGRFGDFSLVMATASDMKAQEEIIMPKLSLEFEKKYLSSKDKKDSSAITVMIDGEIITDGVEFSSSNEKIAKINDDNEVIPVSDGKATITAFYDGFEANEEIRVITPIKTMSFTTTSSSIRVGKDLQMKLQVTPSDACIDTLTYTSSDESIATVDPSGIVTGVSEGKVKITVYDSYTEKEKTVNLTIRK